MPPESAHARGRRLLVEGRVRVIAASPGYISAHVRGDSGEVHRVEHHPERGWSCTCPAYRTCAHRVALMLVAVVRETRAAP